MNFVSNSLEASWAVSWAITATLISVILLAVHQYYKNMHSYWQKLGVSGPKPWPIIGNMAELVSTKRRDTVASWRRKYGKVYGIYEGTRPVLMVSDPDILQQISIKDFDSFVNHDASLELNDLQTHFIFMLRNDHWKGVRSILSPTFTSGKMRRMYKLMENCADDLETAIEDHLKVSSKTGAVVDLKEIFGLYTMDAISTCCYGLKLERKGALDLKTVATRNKFVEAAIKMFDFRVWRVLVLMSINRSFLRLFNFKLTPESHVNPYGDKVKQLIDARRRETTKKFDDYLQILLDAASKSDHDSQDQNNLDSAEAHHAGGISAESPISTKSGRHILSDKEILSNAALLMVVGLETTSILLTHCIYALAFHKQIQEKLFKEISKICQPKGDDGDKSMLSSYKFDYDSLTSHEYLDAVLAESLRAMPPALQADRVSNRHCFFEKYKIWLPSESKVILHLADIMVDEDNWPKPLEFNPDRFLLENKHKIKPGSYCPFGIGPRHCLGMRFSLTEAKLALAKLIMRFQFEPAPNTQFPPDYKVTFGFSGLQKPIVMLKRRLLNE